MKSINNLDDSRKTNEELQQYEEYDYEDDYDPEEDYREQFVVLDGRCPIDGKKVGCTVCYPEEMARCMESVMEDQEYGGGLT